MKTSIIVIGDELLIGQVTDTNSGFLARTMAPMGWEVEWIQTVPDTDEAITRAVTEAMRRSDVVLTTGGLGPTKDDITKLTLCKIFGGTLKNDPEVTKNIREVFLKRGLKMNGLTAAQALVPTSAKIIQNRVGTAPVLWFETEQPQRKVLVSMPGVPFETEYVFTHDVFPQLLKAFPSPFAIAHHTLLVSDITESDLAIRLSDWENSLPPHIHLAYLPKPGLIRLRLDGHSPDAPALGTEMESHIAELRRLCGDNLLYDGDATPAEIMLHHLKAHGLTIATAESCTGGNIAHLITTIPGASECMQGGIVAYSNEVKMRILGVEPSTLEAHGAVSEPVVCQMAAGACRATGADIAIATSGIAGPGGGTPEKPVGTVCIAAASAKGHCLVHTYHFPGNRSRVIDRATTTALLLGLRLINK